MPLLQYKGLATEARKEDRVINTRRDFLKNSALAAALTGLGRNAPTLAQVTDSSATSAEGSYDVLVYGATASGVMASIGAAHEGARVVLLTPGRHVGGMVSGGLSATDMQRQEYLVGGLTGEFFERVAKHYNRTWSAASSTESDWFFEPHVAEDIFNAWLREAGVLVLFDHAVEEVHKDGTTITGITSENGQTFVAKVYIDASYEGDLMARSGVEYVIGREGRGDFGESLAGRQEICPSFYSQIRVLVPAYDDQGRLLPLMTSGDPGIPGQGDHKVQAYNFRVCLTDQPENLVPFAPPSDYDSRQYILAGLVWQGMDKLGIKLDLPMSPLPHNKYDSNTPWGGIGSNFVGESWEYPDADYAKRKKIWEKHLNYTKGFYYFVANDPSVPQDLRNAMSKFGLPKDEFGDTEHWPHQLYVREGRRMRGEYLMKQSDLQEDRIKYDSIGMGGYNMDMMHVQRIPILHSQFPDRSQYVAMNEGYMTIPVEPYQIAYRALLPQYSQCTNLIVPVCMSATKIAYASLRIEAQYMIMGHAAGTAASMAAKSGVAVQQVPREALQNKLRSQGQILATDRLSPEISLKRM